MGREHPADDNITGPVPVLLREGQNAKRPVKLIEGDDRVMIPGDEYAAGIAMASLGEFVPAFQGKRNGRGIWEALVVGGSSQYGARAVGERPAGGVEGRHGTILGLLGMKEGRFGGLEVGACGGEVGLELAEVDAFGLHER